MSWCRSFNANVHPWTGEVGATARRSPVRIRAPPPISSAASDSGDTPNCDGTLMKALITVTDDERFEFLSHQDDHDEVNFWRPRDMETPRIEPGTPYLFKLKQRHGDWIAGFG